MRSSEEVSVMEMERRHGIVQSGKFKPTTTRRSLMSQTKPIEISKHEVKEAYKRVKANKGSAGIDQESLEDFEADKENNLYKLWN